jgi:hypothetical protein
MQGDGSYDGQIENVAYDHSNSQVLWTCVGVTDEAHPFCLFETDNEQWAAEHRDHPGHRCVSKAAPHVEPKDARHA